MHRIRFAAVRSRGYRASHMPARSGDGPRRGRSIRQWALLGALGALATVGAAGGVAQAAPPVAPAGIANYSYFQVQRIEWGNSRFFGDSAKGNGAKFSFQFGTNGYVFGETDKLAFHRMPGDLYQTGVGLGYAQTQGKISAYVQVGYYRRMLSASLGGARSHYWEFAYGMRSALSNWFSLEGELYSDFRPEFGSRPWGVKFGAAAAFGPVSLHLVANHNRDVNALEAMLRFSF